MYTKGFYIKEAIGNNAFSYNKRDNKQIYVPGLKSANMDDISLGDEVAFEDFDFDDKLSSNKGLKNFYEIDWKGKKIYLFDNHNHALYFWYLARDKGLIGDNNTLIHIDEHADTRDPLEYLLKPDSYDLKKVFEYTNFSKVNVGNYIIPAQKEGLIGKVIQIRNKTNLDDYLNNNLINNLNNNNLEFDFHETKSQPIRDWDSNSLFHENQISKSFNVAKSGIILNLDLDFFQPDLDYIDYELKKKVVLDAAEKASIITVSTSPFFIDQELAIKVFKDIFKNKI